MAEILLDISQELIQALDAKAKAEGIKRAAYIRSVLERAVRVGQERYSFKSWGPGKATASLYRSDIDGYVGGGASPDCTEEQYEAVNRAHDLMERNAEGDKEKAFAILQFAFEEVFAVDR